MFCGSGEGIQLRPSRNPGGGSRPLMRAVCSLYDRSQSLVRMAVSKLDSFGDLRIGSLLFADIVVQLDPSACILQL